MGSAGDCRVAYQCGISSDDLVRSASVPKEDCDTVTTATPATPSAGLTVGVDIGGTFTDLCVLGHDGIVAVGKTLTTHDEPAAGVEDVLRRALDDPALVPADGRGGVQRTRRLARVS